MSAPNWCGGGGAPAAARAGGPATLPLVRRAEAPDRRAAERARIILACADGMSNAGAARAAEVAVGTVAKWRRKFAAEGLAGLQDAVRIGRPKADLVLSEAERDQLLRWARRGETGGYLVLGGD